MSFRSKDKGQVWLGRDFGTQRYLWSLYSETEWVEGVEEREGG